MKLETTSGGTFSLKDHKGETLLLFFYPKDNTPGCTREAESFAKAYKKISKLGVRLFGISRDSIKSHEKFKESKKLPFELISDTEEELCQKFDVIKMKNMYGKKVRGIERSTFVIGASGKILKEWRGVKVDGHVDEVLEFLESL